MYLFFYSGCALELQRQGGDDELSRLFQCLDRIFLSHSSNSPMSLG